MSGFARPSVALILLAWWTGTAGAERAPEKKETADYILTGTVEKVFKRQEGRRNEYVVLMSVLGVHKGEGVKKGESFYAYAFQMTPSLFPVAEESGHDDIPKEGQVIKAYVRHRGGRHEANYSDWFEVIEDKKTLPAERK